MRHWTSDHGPQRAYSSLVDLPSNVDLGASIPAVHCAQRRSAAWVPSASPRPSSTQGSESFSQTPSSRCSRARPGVGVYDVLLPSRSNIARFQSLICLELHLGKIDKSEGLLLSGPGCKAITLRQCGSLQVRDGL